MKLHVLALQLHEYNPKRFYCLESKKNLVIQGMFTKLIYTEDVFTINEILFVIPIQYTYLDYPQESDYYTVYFDQSQIQNASVMEKLNKLETEILCSYAMFMNCRKQSSRTIVSRMSQGFFKVRKTEKHGVDSPPKHFLLKVSGIWEGSTHYGLTTKIVESII